MFLSLHEPVTKNQTPISFVFISVVVPDGTEKMLSGCLFFFRIAKKIAIWFLDIAWCNEINKSCSFIWMPNFRLKSWMTSNKGYLRSQFQAADKTSSGYLLPHEFGELLRQLNIDMTSKEIAIVDSFGKD